MKFFIDTEFIEKQNFLQLISIGIVSETGKEFYAVSSEYDESMASDWVKKNVIAPIKLENVNTYSPAMIRAGIIDFIYWETIRKNHKLTEPIKMIYLSRYFEEDPPEFWGYYADYDWVLFCWLFGTMTDLPKGYPEYCNDLKQYAVQVGGEHILKEESQMKHNALEDAQWNLMVFKKLKEFESKKEL